MINYLKSFDSKHKGGAGLMDTPLVAALQDEVIPRQEQTESIHQIEPKTL